MNRTATMERKKLVRAGSFSALESADRAVSGLLGAGFTKEEITVVCSDEAWEQHFRQFEHQDRAGAHAEGAVTAGASIGAHGVGWRGRPLQRARRWSELLILLVPATGFEPVTP